MAINTQFVYTDPKMFVRERNQMVERHLRARDIQDPRVLEAMRKLPRHFFVTRDQEAVAYEDHPLGIACGQTISQPYMVAKMSELLQLKGDEKILEIGAGCGYQASVLGLLAREVIGIEYFERLSRLARENIERVGLRNVRIEHGDGKLGLPDEAPFDRIIVSCSADQVPAAWFKQLRPGGMLLFPFGKTPEAQYLWRWQRGESDWAGKEGIFGVRFVPLL